MVHTRASANDADSANSPSTPVAAKRGNLNVHDAHKSTRADSLQTAPRSPATAPGTGDDDNLPRNANPEAEKAAIEAVICQKWNLKHLDGFYQLPPDLLARARRFGFRDKEFKPPNPSLDFLRRIKALARSFPGRGLDKVQTECVQITLTDPGSTLHDGHRLRIETLRRVHSRLEKPTCTTAPSPSSITCRISDSPPSHGTTSSGRGVHTASKSTSAEPCGSHTPVTVPGQPHSNHRTSRGDTTSNENRLNPPRRGSPTLEARRTSRAGNNEARSDCNVKETPPSTFHASKKGKQQSEVENTQHDGQETTFEVGKASSIPFSQNLRNSIQEDLRSRKRKRSNSDLPNTAAQLERLRRSFRLRAEAIEANLRADMNDTEDLKEDILDIQHQVDSTLLLANDDTTLGRHNSLITGLEKLADDHKDILSAADPQNLPQSRDLDSRLRDLISDIGKAKVDFKTGQVAATNKLVKLHDQERDLQNIFDMVWQKIEKKQDMLKSLSDQHQLEAQQYTEPTTSTSTSR